MDPNPSRGPEQLARILLVAGLIGVAGFLVYQGWGRTHGPFARFAGTHAARDPHVVLIAVDGMTCAGCASSVASQIKKVAGVSDCRVDLERKSAEVTLARTDVNRGLLLAAVTDAGYRGRIEP